jgi:hypothetical protein
MGHLIPAGTGLKKFRSVLVESLEIPKVLESATEESVAEEMPEEVVVVKRTRKKTKTTTS